ncbi:MAG: IscS subfamily cysteine desulfurase [Alistipes senegalensis]|nr:IscS subfamily cysteine desulfurase [Oxalobacter formigenes]MCM1281741.1 IscS subfamily cysteine desulfurase [Alistipes senegalensis]
MSIPAQKTVCLPGRTRQTGHPVYLDYAATTPVDPRVAEKMIPWLCDHFGNAASSSHAYGWEAAQAVETARAHVAALIEASPNEIIWTSGATESNNLAIKGAAQAYKDRGRHIITVATEHKAVLDTVQSLQNQGFETTILTPGENGLITLAQLEQAIRPDTILVSVMWVNNEIGVIQPIAEIAECCRESGILFHCDAAQAAGKLEINLQQVPIDLLTITAHKVYGPKGIGALFVRRKPKARLITQMHGGGHEQGLRSGTLATHQLVGMGEAFRIARQEMTTEIACIRKLAARLAAGLAGIEAILFNGDMTQRIPHNINASFPYIQGEALMMALKGIAVSSGSACTSATREPSHVLRAIGRNPELAHSSIRFTMGRFTTEADIDYAVSLLATQIARLRELSPLWDEYKAKRTESRA